MSIIFLLIFYLSLLGMYAFSYISVTKFCSCEKKCLIPSFLFIFSLTVHAQQTDIAGIDKDTISNYSKYKRSIAFAGLLQTRFLASLADGVNINGKNFNESSTAKNRNDFTLKRARVQIKGNINAHFVSYRLGNVLEVSGKAKLKYSKQDDFSWIPIKVTLKER